MPPMTSTTSEHARQSFLCSMAFFAVRKYQPVNPRCRLSSMGVSVLLLSRNELMNGTKVIDTNSAARSEQLITTGRLYRNLPVSPGNSRKGR